MATKTKNKRKPDSDGDDDDQRQSKSSRTKEAGTQRKKVEEEGGEGDGGEAGQEEGKGEGKEEKKTEETTAAAASSPTTHVPCVYDNLQKPGTAITTRDWRHLCQMWGHVVPEKPELMKAWTVRRELIRKKLIQGWSCSKTPEQEAAVRMCCDSLSYLDAGPLENKRGKKAAKQQQVKCMFTGHTRNLRLFKVVSPASPYRSTTFDIVPSSADEKLYNTPYTIILNKRMVDFVKAVVLALHPDAIVKRIARTIKVMTSKTADEQSKSWTRKTDDLLNKINSATALVLETIIHPIMGA